MVRRRVFLVLLTYVMGAIALMCLFYGAVTMPNPPIESTRFDLQGRVDSLQVNFFFTKLMFKYKLCPAAFD